MSTKDKGKLESIRSALMTRGLSFARISIKAGGAIASRALSGDKGFESQIVEHIRWLTEELGQLKGSLMKVGQLLSTYGEHFLPKEANEVLKTLQQRSPPLQWKAIEKALVAELGHERLHELAVEPEPYAAASIGQVHRAKQLATENQVAIKIQYPGIEDAIDIDLRFLRMALNVLNIAPLGDKFDEIFEEVRSMLQQEMDYYIEADYTRRFTEWLQGDPRYRVPKVYFEFSTSKILTTEFMPGAPVDSPEVKGLSQDRRNRLGAAYLELYLRELLDFGYVQTDPHFGNYRVDISPDGGQDRLVLLDFGAVRQVPQEFLRNYMSIMLGGLNRNLRLIEMGGRGLNLLKSGDPQELVQKYQELCLLICEPFAAVESKTNLPPFMNEDGVYDWGASDLPKRVAKTVSEIAFNFRLRSPPREVVFLDRKLGGAFVFLANLGCKINGRKILEPMLESASKAKFPDSSPNRG